MATIVNARDVRLQAYSPRVATVSISPNLVVSQDQVSGLGLIVSGTKMLFLEATSQVFQIAKSGAVSPASTTLKANLKNITSTPILTVVTGTITPTPTLSNGLVVIPYESMMTDAAMLRLTAVQDGVTYTDEVTIVKVREGIDGLMGFLTNEAHTVAADYLGNVLAYTGAGGSFKVFQGINDITSLCSFTIPSGGNTNALTATINATTGVYSVIGGYPTSVDLVVVLLRATFGTATLDKVFSLAKTKTGIPGANGSTGVDGKRGSRTFYVTLTGATAVYSDTLATTTATADGGPVLNDVVTQYNTSQGFSQTKFYTASGWVIVNAVVDGNLIVSGTIGATQIQTNLLNADNVLTRGLTVRDTSGNIILSSGTNLDYTKVGGTKPPSSLTYANASTYIADAAINNAQIGTLDAQKINTGFFSADRINAGTITADKIAVGTITADRIAAGTITADKINGTNLAVVNGTFSGSLQGASGSFSGSLTASAINAVNTINIAGSSVSTTRSSSSTGNYCAVSLYIPAGETMRIIVFGVTGGYFDLSPSSSTVTAYINGSAVATSTQRALPSNDVNGTTYNGLPQGTVIGSADIYGGSGLNVAIEVSGNGKGTKVVAFGALR